MPGAHRITAIAVDEVGARTVSDPVEVRVSRIDVRALVGVRAVDAFAVEPSSDREANTATFRIWRHGVGDVDLEVNYELGGRAMQGEDYERLTGVAVIPAESKFVDVVIQPLADGLKEGLETVVLRLTESSQYELAWFRRAAVVISDAPWAHPARGVRCIRLRRLSQS